MTVTNLNVFQSGTIASATPINENFEDLRVAVNTVEQSVTSNRTYIDNKVTEINSSIATATNGIKTSGEIFCMNNGKVNSLGAPNILSFSGLTVSFATPFTGTNINGVTKTFTSVQSVFMSGYSDGTYNVFIDLDGNLEILSNTMYRQKAAPSSTLNNLWVNISRTPLEAKIYTVNGWQDFLKIPLGRIYMENGAITGVGTFEYNQNGYNVNKNTMPFILYSPDYTRGVNKTADTTYTAETYGWIYVYYLGYAANKTSSITIDEQTFKISYVQFAGSAYGCGEGMFIPINKGSTYSATNVSEFKFYPARPQ